MLFQDLRVEANFPAERLHLASHNQGRLFWGEHGGTFVLRGEGLEVAEAPGGGRRSDFRDAHPGGLPYFRETIVYLLRSPPGRNAFARRANPGISD